MCFCGYTDEMPEIPQQPTPEEQPTVVQIVYQVPSEEAPMLPEQLSVLEGRTGLIAIVIFAIWWLLWYIFSGESEKPVDIGTKSTTSVDNF